MSRQREKAREVLNRVKPDGELLNTEVTLDAMEAFGREMKISGSKSMAKLVRKMREKQNAYFETDRSSSLKDKYLKEAKKLEVQVDRAVEAVLR